MSLFSTFYAGDLSRVRALVEGTEAKVEDVESYEFSGGLFQPFLMPNDFANLLGDSPGAYWDLERGNLLEENSESGLYRIPGVECDRLIALNHGQMARFSHAWNAKRRQVQSKRPAGRKLSAFWKIALGMTGGLLAGNLSDRNLSTTELVLLVGWLFGWTGLALFRAKRQSRARKPLSDIDWSEKLRGLQDFLVTARRQGMPVYYFWSV